MNRLQKKCFIAASGLHLLLVVILLIGPAFLMSNNQSQEVPELNFVPFKTVDDLVSGGGDPKGALPPPPAPPQAKPEVTPLPPKPEPPKQEPTPEPVRAEKPKPAPTPKDDPESLELPKNSKPKIVVSTTPIVRKTDPQAAVKERAAAEAKAAAERQRIASAVSSATRGLEKNFSPSTEIKLGSYKGPGGGGVPYGNWLSAVKQRYTDAWVVPDGVTDNSATVTASVTIARNGQVISSSIVRNSGNALVDHSVRATLDRVTTAPALPDGAKEDQRTVTINFNVKAKLGLG